MTFFSCRFVPPVALDLAHKMVQLDPGRRLSAHQCWLHPYLTHEDGIVDAPPTHLYVPLSHHQPSPSRLTRLSCTRHSLNTIKGDWHEYEAKQRHRRTQNPTGASKK